MNQEDSEEPAVSEREPLIRVRMLIAYDGQPFRGFAEQRADDSTVARSLRVALSHLVGYEPELSVAGRTDAGVHAWGQVVAFDVNESVLRRYDLERIQKSLNKQLKPSIVIRSVERASSDFDARRSPTARRYRYSIHNAPIASPFLATSAWHVTEELDIAAMNEAAATIVGEHDFSSFCKKPYFSRENSGVAEELAAAGLHRGHLVRRVHSAQWLVVDDSDNTGELVRFDVEAKAFCHQMVRSLVGTMVDIGKGKRPVADMARVLAAKDRALASTPAPPQGLCLWEVLF